MEKINLQKRGLPKLQVKTTTTSASAATSDAATTQSYSQISETTVSGGSRTQSNPGTIKSITITSNGSTMVTSTTSPPSMTPPSAENNPFIHRSGNVPDGTVFIAMGAVVGAIFLAILAWWGVSAYISYRNTKRAKQYDYSLGGGFDTSRNFGNNYQYRIPSNSSSLGTNSTDNDYYGEKNVEKYTSTNTNIDNSSTKLNQSDINNSSVKGQSVNDINARDIEQYVTDSYLNSPIKIQGKFNPIQDDYNGNYSRNSLFISPTYQVVQQQRRKERNSNIFMDSNNNFQESEISLISNRSTDEIYDELNRPEKTASPDRKKKARENTHRRNQSSLGLLASPSKSTVDVTPSTDTMEKKYAKEVHRKTPSMFLDDMLMEGRNI